MDEPVLLFSYGTLRQPEVQRETFGRMLTGRPDAIVGYRLGELVITDPMVIERSGSDRHPVLEPAPEVSEGVPGTVFELSPAELIAADEYEVDDYKRVKVALASGDQAWVYVFADARRER